MERGADDKTFFAYYKRHFCIGSTSYNAGKGDKCSPTRIISVSSNLKLYT